MRPCGWTQEGFLTREQSLSEVMHQDLTTTHELGISIKRISDVLELLLEKGKNIDAFRPSSMTHYKVRIAHSRRIRTCPWAPKQFEWCRTGRGVKYLTTNDFEVTNTRTEESLRGTTLCLHLIRDHSFFGGPGTVYRIDPEKAIHILELTRKRHNRRNE